MSQDKHLRNLCSGGHFVGRTLQGVTQRSGGTLGVFTNWHGHKMFFRNITERIWLFYPQYVPPGKLR